MVPHTNSDRRSFLRAAALAFAGTQPGRNDLARPSLAGATVWLNSRPLAARDLRGKVVLVNFWTYTCINWMRTLPCLRAWADKYMDQGLVVIGVHSPEFRFEKNLDNVRRSAREMRLNYPIAVDSDHHIRRAFRNRFWPALYLVDARGFIRHHQFGEGGYEQSERALQQLLVESGSTQVRHELALVDAHGLEAAADWNNLKSSEKYLGLAPAQDFASTRVTQLNRPRVYAVPGQLTLNHWALAGDWTAGREGIRANMPSGRIAYRFHARDLHMVMGPAARGTTIRFRVLIDGQLVGVAHGIDVRQPPPIRDRLFEIEFQDSGVEAFSFTFG